MSCVVPRTTLGWVTDPLMSPVRADPEKVTSFHAPNVSLDSILVQTLELQSAVAGSTPGRRIAE